MNAEVSTQVNEVIDKLASILGNSSSEVIEAYQQKIIIGGIQDLVIATFSLICIVVGAFLAFKSIRRAFDTFKAWENARARSKEEACWGEAHGFFLGYSIASCALMVIFIPIFCIALDGSFEAIFASKGMAIQQLINQLSGVLN